MQTITILVVDEDPVTREFLADNLTADGYQVTAAQSRERALGLLGVRRFDLVIADVNGQTLSLLDAVRGADELASRVDPDTPMIALSGYASELHRVRLLERGGDDVLQKPFSYPELCARIAAVLRRAGEHRSSRVLRAGPLVIDTRRREVKAAGEPVALTRNEYRLLCALAAEPTRVFTRAELLREVWGYHDDSRTLDGHASRLRRKLAIAVGHMALVVNVWGVGYRLLDSQASR